jgi:hypothetical protein
MEEITIVCDRFECTFDAWFFKQDIYQMVEELYEEEFGLIEKEKIDYEELIARYKEDIFDMYDYRIEEQYKEYLNKINEEEPLW